MLKTMVFIDYQNFNINLNYYIKEQYFNMPKTFNYTKLSKELVRNIWLDSYLIKTFFFAPKPSEQLLEIEKYQKFNNWLNFLKTQDFLEVIEGVHVVKPKEGIHPAEVNLNDYTTYYIEEKGTDVNIAVQLLSKGYNNAFDIAVIVSGDTDFIPVIQELRHIGKNIVLATLPNQNIYRFKGLYDQHIEIDSRILRNSSN